MILSTLALLSCANESVEAFKSSASSNRLPLRNNVGTLSSKLNAATLAVSFEEDLALTLKIIMDHQERSSTVSKEEFVQQMEELAKPAETTNSPLPTSGTVDVSVPYDAAARVAYESFEDKSSTSFEDFQIQYLADAVEYVKSKQPRKSAKEGEFSTTAVVSINTATEDKTTQTQIDTTISGTQTTTTATETEIDDESTKILGFLSSIVTWVRNKM